MDESRAHVFVSSASDSADAVLDVGAQIARLKAHSARAALVFASEHHGRDPAAFSSALTDVLAGIPFIGWLGRNAFSDLSIAEGSPGLSVLVLDDVEAVTRFIQSGVEPMLVAPMLVADMPLGTLRFFSGNLDHALSTSILPALTEQGVVTVGAGNPTSAKRPSTVLASNADVNVSAALMSLSGVRALTMASQMARPLGPSRKATRAEGNVILEIDGRPALERLFEDLLPEGFRDLSKLKGRLMAGVNPDDDATPVALRDVVGVDPRLGALALSFGVDEGDPVVFGLKDASAARANLESDLFAFKKILGRRRPLAVVVFSNHDRGSAAFDVPHYDVERVMDVLGPLDAPVVGVSGVAEIGPAGPRIQLFSSSLIVVALLPSGN